MGICKSIVMMTKHLRIHIHAQLHTHNHTHVVMPAGVGHLSCSVHKPFLAVGVCERLKLQALILACGEDLAFRPVVVREELPLYKACETDRKSTGSIYLPLTASGDPKDRQSFINEKGLITVVNASLSATSKGVLAVSLLHGCSSLSMKRGYLICSRKNIRTNSWRTGSSVAALPNLAGQ